MRRHEPEKPDNPLERFRRYLYIQARLQADPQFRPNLDLSGVVQQTLREAHQAQAQLRHKSEPQKAAWLRGILVHNLADEVRKLTDCRHDVFPKRSEAGSSSRPKAFPAEDQSSANQRAGSTRNEKMVQLTEALAQLPTDQRIALELHHLKGRPLADVSQRMERSKEAVVKLLVRAVKRLRELLPSEPHDDT
jgi:RNA polymerase sigma-70 factor (ECF subfamily)